MEVIHQHVELPDLLGHGVGHLQSRLAVVASSAVTSLGGAVTLSFTCLSTSSVIFLILALQSMLNRSSCLSMNSSRSWRSSLVSRQ